MNVKVKVKKAGRKRRAAGWMMLTLGLLVAGVWVASGWLCPEHFSPKWNILVDRGIVRVRHSSNAIWSANYPASTQPRYWLPSFEWWGDDYYAHAHSWGFIHWEVYPLGWRARVFLWPLPLLLWTTGGLALWSGRRARRRALEGHCPTCGYNLAGLNRDAGVCPECGRKKS